MSHASSIIDRFAERAGALYSLPVVAMEVLELTNHPKVDAKALKQCIENDPALTTKILRVVNSSLFGLSREVSDLNQALALLGTKPLKLLVLGFSLPERLFVGLAGDILGHYWRRTLTKAIAARELCDIHWKQGGDEAFIAGLLGDVGVLVLLKDLGEPYASFLEKVVEENGDLSRMETEALGFDHAALSARLLQLWGLPATLTDAIALPKHIDELRRLSPAQGRLPQILHMAELLAQLVSERRIGALPDLLEAAKSYRGITRLQITALVEQLGDKVQQLAEVLSLELPHDKEYCEVLAEAHARLSAAAEDAAAQLAQRGNDPESWCAEMLVETRNLAAAAQAVAAAPLPVVSHNEVPEAEKIAASTARGDVSSTRAAVPHGSVTWQIATSSTGAGSASVARTSAPARAAVADQPLALAAEGELEFIGQLSAAVSQCRQARCELSLLLAEVDRAEQLVEVYGVEGQQHLVLMLETACRVLDHPGKVLVRVHDLRRAIVLPGCDRRQAVEFGNELLRTVRQLLERRPVKASLPLSVSIGAATVAAPRKNFASHDLAEAADRCLYGGHVSGGNTVKSIEIY